MLRKTLKVLTLAFITLFIWACPNAKTTSIFLKNHTDKAIKISFIGTEKPFFELDTEARNVAKLLSKCKLKTRACKEGTVASITSEGFVNSIEIPAKSTTEIVFPLYKVLGMSSAMSLETEIDRVRKLYPSHQFEELFKTKKDIFYIDLK